MNQHDIHTLPDFPFLKSFKSYFLDSVLFPLLGKYTFQDLLPAGRAFGMGLELEYESIKFKKKTLYVVAISFYLTFQQYSSLNHLLKTREESKTKAIHRISS